MEKNICESFEFCDDDDVKEDSLDSQEVPKSKARRKSNKLGKKRMIKSDSEGEGSHSIDDDREERRHSQWVQCDNPQCQKWRRIDSADCLEEYVAAKWVCGMNKDRRRGSCEASQETLDSDDDDDICYTNHTPGMILWGKVPGYPWWPCMVEDDPDLNTFFWNEDSSTANELKTSIHVTFFGRECTRAWLFPHSLRTLIGDEKLKDMGTMTYRSTNFRSAVAEAFEDARECLKLPVQERLENYGFWIRFTGEEYPGNAELSEESEKKNHSSLKRKIQHSSAKAKEVKKKRLKVSTSTKRKNIKEKEGESLKSKKKELKPKVGKKIGTPKGKPSFKKIAKKDSLTESSGRVDKGMLDDDVSNYMDTSNASDSRYSEFSFIEDKSINNNSKEFSDNQLLASVAECVIAQSTPQSFAQSTSKSFTQSPHQSFEIVANSKSAEGNGKKFNHEEFLKKKNSSMQLTKEEINSVPALVKPTLIPINEKKVSEMAEKMMQEEKKKMQRDKKKFKKSENERKEGEELEEMEEKCVEVKKKSKKLGGKQKEKQSKDEKSPGKGDEGGPNDKEVTGTDAAKGNKTERKKSFGKKRKIESDEIVNSKVSCKCDEASQSKLQDDLQGKGTERKETAKEIICTDDDDFIEGSASHSDAIISKEIKSVQKESGKEKAARKSKEVDKSKKSKSQAIERSKRGDKAEGSKKEKKESRKSSKNMKQDEKQTDKHDFENRNKEEGDERYTKSMPKKADKKRSSSSKFSNDLHGIGCEGKETKKDCSEKIREASKNYSVSYVKPSGNTKKAPKVVSSLDTKKIDAAKRDDGIPDDEKPSSALNMNKIANNEDAENNKKGKMMHGKGKRSGFCVPRKKENTATKDTPTKKVTTAKSDVSVTKMGHGSTKVGNYSSPKKVTGDLLKKDGLDSPMKDSYGSPKLEVRSSPMKVGKKRTASDKENGSCVVSDSQQEKTKNPKRYDGQCMTIMASYNCNIADIKKDLFLSSKDKKGLPCSQSKIIPDFQSTNFLQEDAKQSPKKRIPLAAKESPVFSQALLCIQSPKKSSKTNKLKLSKQQKDHEELSQNSQDIISFEEAIHLISESSITTSQAAPRFNMTSTDDDETNVACQSSNACTFIDESPLVPQSGNEDLPFSAILDANALTARQTHLLFFDSPAETSYSQGITSSQNDNEMDQVEPHVESLQNSVEDSSEF